MKKNRVTRFILLFATLLFLLTCCASLTPAPPLRTTPPPAVGEQLPAINLTSPSENSIRTYLGLTDTGSKTFSPSQIECEILLIEIFSMYCPFCQRKAADVNKLFNLMQNDHKLSRQIKLIGIGVGNSAFEVGIFKNKYNVEFPLFADENFNIHNKLDQVRTPFFMAIANSGEKKNQIMLTKLGDFSNPKIFLHSLVELIKPAVKGENNAP